MYYCDENHVCEICNRLSLPLTISEAQEFLLSSINEQDEKSKNKFFTHRLSLNKNKSDGSFITIAQSKYDKQARLCLWKNYCRRLEIQITTEVRKKHRFISSNALPFRIAIFCCCRKQSLIVFLHKAPKLK